MSNKKCFPGSEDFENLASERIVLELVLGQYQTYVGLAMSLEANIQSVWLVSISNLFRNMIINNQTIPYVLSDLNNISNELINDYSNTAILLTGFNEAWANCLKADISNAPVVISSLQQSIMRLDKLLFDYHLSNSKCNR